MRWEQSTLAERKAWGKAMALTRNSKSYKKSPEHKLKISESNKATSEKKKLNGYVNPRCYSRRKPKEIALNHIYRQYKAGAKYRDIDFDLTKSQVSEIIEKDCFYCGASPRERTVVLSHYPVSVVANGIDRIDSLGHYSKENCVPCCLTCNLMKNKSSFSEFKAQIERIYKKICI